MVTLNYENWRKTLYIRKESTSVCNLCDVEKYSLFRGSFSSFCNCRQVLARGYFARILAWKSKKRTQVRLHLSTKKSGPEGRGRGRGPGPGPGGRGDGGNCPSTFGRIRKLMETIFFQRSKKNSFCFGILEHFCCWWYLLTPTRFDWLFISCIHR